MSFRIQVFDNPRMDNAFFRYQEAFGTTKEIGLFGLKITGKTAEIFEKLVDNAILSRTRLTENQLAEMYNDVPFPGEDVVY